jgi:hypothetical protein
MTHHKGAICALFLVALVVPPVEAAKVLYSFTGVDFTTNTGPYSNSSSMTLPCDPLTQSCGITRINAEFVIDDLGANFAFGQITPDSWSISDGLTTVTDLTPGWSFTTPTSINTPLQASTDTNGEINFWLFSIWSDNFDNAMAGEAQQMRTRQEVGLSVGNQTGYCQADDGASCTSNGLTVVSAGSGVQIGSWTMTVVPVPAAAWLFMSGLGLLIGVGRRSVSV